ncbi:polyadenylate-binding protein 4-like [Salvia divinorum]|uniref:Polyadenylate-binding protein 4-like n=1 Tax=Salvia divinorum TaxID=28513 RepID=A0ABD1FMP6_SALDI
MTLEPFLRYRSPALPLVALAPPHRWSPAPPATTFLRPVRVKDMICDYGAVNSGRHLKGQQASKLHKPFKPVWDYTSNVHLYSNN